MSWLLHRTKGTFNVTRPRGRALVVLCGAVLVGLGSAWMLLSPVTITTVRGTHAQCVYDALSTVFAPPDTDRNIGVRCIAASRGHVALWGGATVVSLLVACWAVWRFRRATVVDDRDGTSPPDVPQERATTTG